VEIARDGEERGRRKRRRHGLADVDVACDDCAIHRRANDRVLEIQLGAVELRARQRNQSDTGTRRTCRLPKDRHGRVKVGFAHQRFASTIRVLSRMILAPSAVACALVRFASACASCAVADATAF
jgi:hypothetical protein